LTEAFALASVGVTELAGRVSTAGGSGRVVKLPSEPELVPAALAATIR
jgi:hypothetical protein